MKETGLYDLGRGQGRVKMIRVVEAGIEIDGNVRGRLLPLVASLGNGCTFLRIKIILHKTTCFLDALASLQVSPLSESVSRLSHFQL